MEKIQLLVPNEWRKLKNVIMALLKKGFASEVVVINYAKTYILVDKKLVKKEKKLISFQFSHGDSEAVIGFIEQVSGRKRTLGDLQVL